MVGGAGVERGEHGDGLPVQQLPEHLEAPLAHGPRHLQLGDPVRVHHPLHERGGDLVDAGHAVQQRRVRDPHPAAVGDERPDEVGAARLEAVQERRDGHPLPGPVRAEPLRRREDVLARLAVLQRGEHPADQGAGVAPGLLLRQRGHQLRPAAGGADRRLQQHRIVGVLKQQPQEPIARTGPHPPIVRPGCPFRTTRTAALGAAGLAGRPGHGVRWS
ncbi:hypothetical protein ACQEU6_10145 [Spirillospora sp. CA-108201]